MSQPVDARDEVASSAVLLAIAAAYFGYGLRYPVDALSNPGPGAFPRALGAALLLLATVHLLTAIGRLRAARVAGPRPAAAQDAPATPWAMIAILVLQPLLVGRLGFLSTAFALTVASTKLLGTQGWARPAALGAGVALACHLLFAVWLHVPLPRGLLG